MKKESDLIYALLKCLQVKHTSFYLNKLYDEHPHKYNLFGLSRILKEYNIENKGYKFEDKDILKDLDAPFIAQYKDHLVIVLKQTQTHIHYYINGKEFSLSISEFKENWSGVTLLIGDCHNAFEPGYKSNRLKEIYFYILNIILCLSIIVIPTLIIFSNGGYDKAGILILLILNIFGTYIGYLLVLKQIKIHSSSADKICSIFKKSDCNNVLESKAAKLWGIIGWSEAGLSYFSSNLIILLLFPKLLFYLALINIGILPYSVWSIWYQRFKIKQWCALCLIVQALFYCIFINNLLSGFIQIPEISWINLSIVALVYILPFCLISILLPVFTKSHQISLLRYEFNRLKMNNKVFSELLHAKERYDTDDISHIVFGNSKAKNQITIISNPHCEPCGTTHEKVDKLLDHLEEDNTCIRFIFINFDKNVVKDSGKFLIAAYLNNKQEIARDIYKKWFAKEKYTIDKTYTKYGFDLNSEYVLREQCKHEQWSEQNKIYQTPTVLFNGYILPDIYNIEDIRLLI